jgi:drug/metabolite transporter (DMT)-like permease
LNKDTAWPSPQALCKASCIAGFDFLAQALNYTGSAMCGPTVFAIIYSSVTVWTAVFSWVVLKRSLNLPQWVGIISVFGGLVRLKTEPSFIQADVEFHLIFSFCG